MKITGILLNPASDSKLETFVESPSHAVLISGPAGSGKTHIASGVASILLSTDDIQTHAYFRTIAPVDGLISIEQIRELISFFSLKVPGTAVIRRVAVIEDADRIGREAQNALLKTLEEPPSDSILILTSSRTERLLPTIRSRLQKLQIATPTTESLRTFFKDQGFDAAIVSSALIRYGDNVADVTRMLTDPDSSAETTVDLVKQALSADRYDRLLMVDKLYKQKELAADFTSTLSTIAMVSIQSAATKRTGTIEKWKSVLEAAHTAQNALALSGNTKLVLTELMLAF